MWLSNELKLGSIQSGLSRPYGVRFRDGSGDTPAVNDFIYQRTGTLSYYAPLETVPDALLSVHRRMRRCVLDGDGEVVYYLDPMNSMWIEGNNTPYSSGEIIKFTGDYVGTRTLNGRLLNAVLEITISAEVDENEVIGRVIRCYSPTAELYGVIVGYDTDTSVISIGHPHCIIPEGLVSYEIGTAKLDGTDGNVMVEIPGFWYRYSNDGGWQQHEIGLSKFAGAVYLPPMYISAFEGVSADANGVFDGWVAGGWNTETNVFTTPTGSVGRTPTRLRSVAGYYADSSFTRSYMRTRFAAEGTGYHQYDYVANWILQLLILIECGSFYVDTYIGLGISDVVKTGIDPWNLYNTYLPLRRSGDTIPAGNASWAMSTLNRRMLLSAIDDGYRIQSLSYRGIENPYGHIFKWVDGVNLYFDKEMSGETLLRDYFTPYVCESPSQFADDRIDNGYAKTDDQVNTHWADSGTYAARGRYTRIPSQRFFAVEPILNLGSSTTYMCDYMYVPSTVPADRYRVLAVGGIAFAGRFVGPWCVRASFGSGSSHAYFGGRLCFSGKRS